MAQPDIVRGTYITIMLGNGAPTEVFEPVCGIISKGFTAQVNTTDVFTRDCANPEDIPIRRLIQTGKQWDMSGSGQLDRSKLADMQEALGVTRNWRYVIGEPTGDAVYGGYYAGPAMLTQIQHSGDDGDFAGIDLTIASDGQWNFVPVVPAP